MTEEVSKQFDQLAVEDTSDSPKEGKTYFKNIFSKYNLKMLQKKKKNVKLNAPQFMEAVAESAVGVNALKTTWTMCVKRIENADMKRKIIVVITNTTMLLMTVLIQKITMGTMEDTVTTMMVVEKKIIADLSTAVKNSRGGFIIVHNYVIAK